MSKVKVASAIYIGSNAIQLKISENRKGKNMIWNLLNTR